MLSKNEVIALASRAGHTSLSEDAISKSIQAAENFLEKLMKTCETVCSCGNRQIINSDDVIFSCESLRMRPKLAFEGNHLDMDDGSSDSDSSYLESDSSGRDAEDKSNASGSKNEFSDGGSISSDDDDATSETSQEQLNQTVTYIFDLSLYVDHPLVTSNSSSPPNDSESSSTSNVEMNYVISKDSISALLRKYSLPGLFTHSAIQTIHQLIETQMLLSFMKGTPDGFSGECLIEGILNNAILPLGVICLITQRDEEIKNLKSAKKQQEEESTTVGMKSTEAVLMEEQTQMKQLIHTLQQLIAQNQSASVPPVGAASSEGTMEQLQQSKQQVIQTLQCTQEELEQSRINAMKYKNELESEKARNSDLEASLDVFRGAVRRFNDSIGVASIERLGKRCRTSDDGSSTSGQTSSEKDTPSVLPSTPYAAMAGGNWSVDTPHV
eukprot:gene7627-15614_t